jgi:hypothetical protein
MFSSQQILNLVGQLGGNHQQAAQELEGLGLQNGQVDPNQHGGFLSKFGINPQQLLRGGYQQHFEAQRQRNFQGFGYGYGEQEGRFGGRDWGDSGDGGDGGDWGDSGGDGGD